MKVQDLMTRRVATVGAQDSLARAVKLMQERDCGCIVVIDEASKVAGILTDRGVCLAALRTDKPLSRLKARDCMRTEVFTCAPNDGVAEAEQRMGQHQVRRLPVVDAKGRLRGILSLDDLAREACREEGLIAPPVSTKDVGRTLGEVGRPHLIEGHEHGGTQGGRSTS